MRSRSRDRIRYLIERLFSGGVLAQLLVLVAAVTVISFLGGVLASLLSPEEFEFPASTWWAFLRLTDPGYLGDDTGQAIRVLSTALTVTGYVVFMGALIAVLTQGLHRAMDTLGRGLTKFPGRNHIAVVGVTVRTPVIIRQLLGAEGRVKRYLRRTNAARLRVVVLDQREGVRAGEDLRGVIGPAWDGRKVIFRSGSPLRPDRLALLNATEAGSVIIPSSDFRRSGAGLADAITIKALLSLQRSGRNGSAGPVVVAEIREEKYAAVARASFYGELELVASDQVVGRLMTLTVRQPGMSHVYSELLNHELGSEIFVREYRGPATSFGECAARARDAICIGILMAAERGPGPMLNPHSDLAVEQGDRLILVSSSFGNTTIAAQPQRRRTRRSSSNPAPLRPAAPVRVLVLGWNSRVPKLIAELAKYTDADYELVVVSLVPAVQRERVATMRSGPASSGGATTTHVEADCTDAEELAAVDPSSFNVILILASEVVETAEYADARTVMATLLVRHICGSGGPRVVVELAREESVELLPETVDDVIVSSQIVSYILTQVALRRDLNRVYSELFMPGGSEIVAIPLSHYLPNRDTTPLCFADVAAATAGAGHTAIGYRTGKASIHLNPNDDTQIASDSSTELIVLVSGAPAMVTGGR